MTRISEQLAAAYHETGHAISIVAAFRDAAWLPKPPPGRPVRYVEIMEQAPGPTGT
jgi:hypothetical protein